jgi:membrane protein implicated in regulation of membrane protease activity
MTKRLTGGWTVEISPRGLRAAFVFFVVFGVAIAANSPVLNAVGGGAILVALVAMSIWAVARMIRRRRITPYGQDSIMPARLKRWILDEPDEDRK